MRVQEIEVGVGNSRPADDTGNKSDSSPLPNLSVSASATTGSTITEDIPKVFGNTINEFKAHTEGSHADT